MSTNHSSGLWMIRYGELGATLKALQDHGVTLTHLAHLRADSGYAGRVAEFMLREVYAGSLACKQAREILKHNFFGVEEWQTLYRARLTTRQFRSAEVFPWSAEFLEAPCPFEPGKRIKETHFAFLGLPKLNGAPLTIKRWRELHPKTGQPRFSLYSMTSDQRARFATAVTCKLRWYLMLITPVPHSAELTYQEQINLLPLGYEVPLAIEETTKNLLYFRKNGVWPNQRMLGRCRDLLDDSDNRRPAIGTSGSGLHGLEVSTFLDTDYYWWVGLAASRIDPNSAHVGI